jgi:RimJ/RimL family protein N-acetyltransferase
VGAPPPAALGLSQMTFDYQPQLTGELIAMRPTTADDYAPLFTLGSDPGVWELHPQSDRWREAVFRPFFEDGLASGGALTAICRATGEVAGWSRYSSLYASAGEIEIGWTFLGRKYWGGAYNSDMKRIMLAHAFRFVDQVIFRIGEHNLRSRRAVEKLGASLTDRTDTAPAVAGPALHVYYVLPRAVFEAARAS